MTDEISDGIASGAQDKTVTFPEQAELTSEDEDFKKPSLQKKGSVHSLLTNQKSLSNLLVEREKQGVDREAALLEVQHEFLQDLVNQNTEYHNYISGLGNGDNFDAKTAATYHRKYFDRIHHLQQVEDYLEKNTRLLHKLESLVTKRQQLLENLSKTAEDVIKAHDTRTINELTRGARQNIQDYENHSTEFFKMQSQQLTNQLEKLNGDITTLEMQWRNERKCERKLYRLFASYKEFDEEGKPKEIHGRQMNLTEFAEFWNDKFSAKLDERRFRRFFKNLEEYKMAGFVMGEDFDISNNKEWKTLLVTPQLFVNFLKLDYGIDPAMAIFLINDKKLVKNYVDKSHFSCCRHLLFILLVFFLLMCCTEEYGSWYDESRYHQTTGVKQMLVDYMWNDMTLEHVVSAGLIYDYMLAILIPFTSGVLEYQYGQTYDLTHCREIDRSESDHHSHTNAGYACEMNPYFIGGFRMRQVRSNEEECRRNVKDPNQPGQDYFNCIVAPRNLDWDKMDTGLYVETSDTYWSQKWANTSLGQPIPFTTADENEDYPTALNTRPSLSPTIMGGGFVWDFDGVGEYNMTCDYYEDCDLCEKHQEIYEEYDLKTVPYSMCRAVDDLVTLRDNDFFDGQTRAVIIDVNSFNPSKKLHTLARLVFGFWLGGVETFDTINTYAFIDSKGWIYWCYYTLFVILLVIFTYFHLKDLYFHTHTLGCPICCTKCIDEELSAEMAKLPYRVRWYQLEHGDVNFMSYSTQGELQQAEELRLKARNVSKVAETPGLGKNATQGELLIPIDGVVPLKVHQKQTVFTDLVLKFVTDDKVRLRNRMRGNTRTASVSAYASPIPVIHIDDGPTQEPKVQYKECIPTNYGGCELTLVVDNSKFFDDHNEEKLKELAQYIEHSVQDMPGFKTVNVLSKEKPTNFEKFFGLGAISFYSRFWNVVDSCIIFLFFLYIIVSFTIGTATTDGKDSWIDVTQFTSLRRAYILYLVSSYILFFGVIVACVKLFEFAMSLNHTFRKVFLMIRLIGREILSFALFFVYVLICFALAGMVLFSDEFFEFADFNWSFITLIRAIFGSLPELDENNGLVLIYYFLWAIIMVHVTINILLAVLLNAWDDLTRQQEIERREGSFFPMLTRFFGGREEHYDPFRDDIEEPSQWQKIYPAGCPKRRLKSYLKNQLDNSNLTEEDIDDIISLMGVESQGTVSWDYLQKFLFDMKENINRRAFLLHREQTEHILESTNRLRDNSKNIANKIVSREKGIQEKLNKLQEMVNLLSAQSKVSNI